MARCGCYRSHQRQLGSPFCCVWLAHAYWPPAQRVALWLQSPFYWYFTSALPRALLVAFPLSWVSLASEPRARPYVLVAFVFVATYSLLPHKELRFVLYTVPLLNVAAAAGASHPKISRVCAFPPMTFPAFDPHVCAAQVPLSSWDPPTSVARLPVVPASWRSELR